MVYEFDESMNGNGQLRYLSASDVTACLPPLADQIIMASEALQALASGAAELPPKIGVHPRAGAVVHAMPAMLRPRDLVGMKWIATYPANSVAGIPPIDALIILNDSATGRITDVLDGTVITGVRTAAVSAVAMRLYRPSKVEQIAIVGAGLQGATHAAIAHHLFPEALLTLHDRHPDRALALVRQLSDVGASARACADLLKAIEGADIIVTAAKLGSSNQELRPEWLSTEALVISIDMDTFASAALARGAAAFVVDDRERFSKYLEEGAFANFPMPAATLGEGILHGLGSIDRTAGRILVCPLGVGLADILFASMVVRAATDLGIGLVIER